MKNKLFYIVMSLMLSFCSKTSEPLIIGHRGAKGHAAENTLPSIKKAIELGVDGIEIDVFICGTGELVVFHDKTLDKLTDSMGYIEELSLDSIRKITVLDQAPIPTLSEVLDEVSGKVFLNIELKGEGTARPTNDLLQQYFNQGKLKPSEVFISSFNWTELRLFFEVNKKVPVAVLIEDKDPLKALGVAKELNAMAINPNQKTLTLENVTQIKEAGFKIYPWTVNLTEDIQRMKELKVDGIITDFPERIFPSRSSK